MAFAKITLYIKTEVSKNKTGYQSRKTCNVYNYKMRMHILTEFIGLNFKKMRF